MALSLKLMIQSSVTEPDNWSVYIKCLHIKQVRYGVIKLRSSMAQVKFCRALQASIACLCSGSTSVYLQLRYCFNKKG